MHNYKLTIAYDGTNYSGWQVQDNATSIQQLIQESIKTVVRDDLTLIGSGRTDAGVHAWGQVAHFKCNNSLDLYRLLASLNGLLPVDIRILQIEEVDLRFHAQISAQGKTYHYHLYLDHIQDPFRRLYSYHVRRPCDLVLLQKSAAFFIGTHNFTSFANEAHSGSASRNPVRTISSLNLIPEQGGICLEFTADGFLYKMVRNIVGTMLEVASGKRSLKEIPFILDGQDRRLAGQAAPPHGLFLTKVYY